MFLSRNDCIDAIQNRLCIDSNGCQHPKSPLPSATQMSATFLLATLNNTHAQFMKVFLLKSPAYSSWVAKIIVSCKNHCSVLAVQQSPYHCLRPLPSMREKLLETCT